MPPFGRPAGCECSNYFELNGKPQHEDDCPAAQGDDALVDWAERQLMEEKAFEIGYPEDDIEDEVHEIMEPPRRRSSPPRVHPEDDA